MRCRSPIPILIKGLIYEVTHQAGHLVCQAECSQMPTAHRTYQERAYLTHGKHRRLDEAFRECAHLYNGALKEWRTCPPWRAAYRQAGIGRTYYDQAQELTGIRAQDHFLDSVSIQFGRGVLRRLERAMQSLFRRVRAGEKAGYPKFKSGRRWKSIEIAEPTSAVVTDRRGRWSVKVKELPVLPLRVRRDLPPSSCLKALTITRKPTGVYVSLTYALEIDETVNVPKEAVGLNVGVAVRITASDGWSVERRSPDAERVASLQQRIARCRSGSNTRRKLVSQLTRLRHRERVSNRNECHRITTELVRRYGVVVVEDLAITNMTGSARGTIEDPGGNVRAKSGLNRSIQEQTWGLLRQ